MRKGEEASACPAAVWSSMVTAPTAPSIQRLMRLGRNSTNPTATVQPASTAVHSVK